jgi:tRNA (guanosine-2'-O-)-methyltransferase
LRELPFFIFADDMKQALIQYLSECVTAERIDLFDRLLEERTRYLTLVLEDVFQPQNASAVVRTVDCFGLQDLYVIENGNRFVVDREIAMGASKWIDIIKFKGKKNNTMEAITHLRQKGYRIVGTSPHEGGVNLEDYDLTKGKTALFFGTELTGISPLVMKEADEFLKIPMYGFTESLNISVSVAIILHDLTHQMRFHSQVDWHLTPDERADIKLNWLRNSIKHSALIEARFLRTTVQR